MTLHSACQCDVSSPSRCTTAACRRGVKCYFKPDWLRKEFKFQESFTSSLHSWGTTVAPEAKLLTYSGCIRELTEPHEHHISDNWLWRCSEIPSSHSFYQERGMLFSSSESYAGILHSAGTNPFSVRAMFTNARGKKAKMLTNVITHVKTYPS